MSRAICVVRCLQVLDDVSAMRRGAINTRILYGIDTSTVQRGRHRQLNGQLKSQTWYGDWGMVRTCKDDDGGVYVRSFLPRTVAPLGFGSLGQLRFSSLLSSLSRISPLQWCWSGFLASAFFVASFAALFLLLMVERPQQGPGILLDRV